MIREQVEKNYPHYEFGQMFQEHESATRKSYNERPEFIRLMHCLEKGDVLVVWKLNRIDRVPTRMIEAIHFLINRGVDLVVLENGGVKLDLSTAMGRAIVAMWSMFNDFWLENHREVISESMQWLKRNGRVYCSNVPFGHRRIESGEVNRRGKPIKLDVWDQAECLQLAEIVWRKDNGEGFMAIARDFERRGERRANGQAWARRYGTAPEEGRQLMVRTFKRAYDYAKTQLDETGTIGGVTLDDFLSVKTLREPPSKPFFLPETVNTPSV